MSARNYVAQADALLDADLTDASVDVQSLAAVYRKRQKDRRAHVFARALVRRAESAGYAIPAGSPKLQKADLEREVERRNAGRVDDSLIVVEGTGRGGSVTKADLEAALQADDERG